MPKFMSFTSDQEKIVYHQLKAHDRDGGVRRILLDQRSGDYLELHISRGVFGSDIMSSGIYTSRYLYRNRELYAGKVVLDMGCGAGALGILMASRGADDVTLVDINPRAIADAQKNVDLLRLTNCSFVQSNLFANVPQRRFDLMVFNHPFFSGDAERSGNTEDLMLSRSMLGGRELISHAQRLWWISNLSGRI